MAKMFGMEAAVKTFISPIDKPLLPWETVQMFDVIRPAFEEQGLNLIRPFGAVNNELYLPLVNGVSVESYLRSIGNPELSGALRKALEERTLPLHHAVHKRLHSAIEEKGLHRVKEGEQLKDNDPDVYPDPLHPGYDIRAMVDLHPGQAAHTYDLTRRYRNWMISDKDIKILEASGSISQAVDTFLKSVQAVDPILVYSRHKNASPIMR
jgi:hypothetical protein